MVAGLRGDFRKMSWMLFLVFCLLFPGSAPGGPILAASGKAKTLEIEVLSRLPVEDTSNHELTQSRGVDSFTTPDRIAGVSFEDARLHTRSQGDLVDGAGLVRGYGVLEARTGEKLYVVFGYEIPPGDEGRRPFEGTFEWSGGTGVLTGVRGSGTLRGDLDSDGRAEYRWEASYRNTKEEP